MTPRRVLVTGSAGAVGGAVAAGLAASGHQVRGFDRSASPGLDDQVVGTLTDAAAVDRAVAGCAVVVHGAATPDEADFVSDLVPNNIVGSQHLFASALRHGVERVVYVSTVRVATGDSARPRPITVAQGYCPDGFYALSKVCGEVMGELYVRRGLASVLCVRLGWFLRNAAEAARMARGHHGVYLSRADCLRFFASSVECAHRGFAVLFATSRAPDPPFDLSDARRVIGYEPVDTWPEGIPWPRADWTT